MRTSPRCQLLALCAALATFSLSAFGQSCEIVVPFIIRPEKPPRKAALPSNGDFFINVHGTRIKGRVLDRKPGGRHVAVLLDGSGSMRKLWSLSQRLTGEVVQTLNASDEVAYQRFGETFNQSLPASSGREPILAAIGSTEPPHGGTALRDAMAAALAQPGFLRKDDAIVLITDGQDNVSKLKESALERQLIERQVRLFPIMVVDLFDPDNPAFPETLRQIDELVEATGGYAIWPLQTRFRFVGDPKHLDDRSMNELTLQLRVLTEGIDRANVVAFSLPEGLPRTSRKNLQIDLMDEAGQKLKGIRLVYPKHPPICN